MKKILPKVNKILNMSIKQAKFYGDNEVKIEHIIISLINDYNNNAVKVLLDIGVDLVPFNVEFGTKRLNHFIETGDEYIPKNLLEDKGIDSNYYKIKGKHINNP